MRYRCIDRRRAVYSVRMMCRLLKLSRSGYYAWRVRPESERDKTDRELTRVIRRIHTQSKGTYGSPRIRAELSAEGLHYGRHKVARLMRLAGIQGCPQRRFKVTTRSDPSHPVASNLLKQDFSAPSANQRWVADMTCLSTQQGWWYLAVVMDLYSRRIVGWSMDRWMSRHLVIDALSMALGTRNPEDTLIHHSDRGAQYTSDDFRNMLDEHAIQCSMSAGTGVTHSEYNHSSDEPVHFLQIWLFPNRTGVVPGYEQRSFPLEDRREKLVLLVSPDGRDGSIASHQDALLYGTLLESGQRLSHLLADDRRAYVHVADGKASVNGEALGAGDAMAIEGHSEVQLQGINDAELLVFDLP